MIDIFGVITELKLDQYWHQGWDQELKLDQYWHQGWDQFYAKV